MSTRAKKSALGCLTMIVGCWLLLSLPSEGPPPATSLEDAPRWTPPPVTDSQLERVMATAGPSATLTAAVPILGQRHRSAGLRVHLRDRAPAVHLRERGLRVYGRVHLRGSRDRGSRPNRVRRLRLHGDHRGSGLCRGDRDERDHDRVAVVTRPPWAPRSLMDSPIPIPGAAPGSASSPPHAPPGWCSTSSRRAGPGGCLP